MALRPIPLDDRPPRPWRNGGGTARDLLRLPADAGANGDGWYGQVSVAEVARDGDFSAYPGVERWFAVLDGAGIDLTVDGTTTRLTRASEPLRFDGGAATRAALVDGPTRDLNLMLHGARGRIARVEDGASWRSDAAQCGLYAGSAGRCAFRGEAVDVAATTLLWFDVAPASLVFAPTAAAAAPGATASSSTTDTPSNRAAAPSGCHATAPSYWLAVTPVEAAP